MKRVPADELTSIVAQAFVSVGAPPTSAKRVARGLVRSNLAGVDTHGVRMAPRYLAAIEAAELDPAATPTILEERGATALVSGRWGFGHVSADLATSTAIRAAQDVGIAMVGLVESHHIGRLGEYVERAAQSGVALLVFGGGQGEERPAAVPYGGARAVLHTNPIAIGVPAENDRPLVFDIATSVMAGAKIDQARARGEMLPAGAIVDASGRPSTDPRAFFDGGAHLPFGGHKGFGFMLVAELFGRVLTGADRYQDRDRGGPIFRHAGNLFIALDVDRLAPRSLVRERTLDLFDRIRSTPPADGFESVQVPGDIEAAHRASRRRDGIPLDDALYLELRELAGITD